MVERRGHTRFEMGFPVLVQVTTHHGERLSCRSRVENISGGGLFVKLDHEVPVGAPITALVTLADDTTLAVNGQVVRSMPQDGTYGLAVRYSEYRFE